MYIAHGLRRRKETVACAFVVRPSEVRHTASLSRSLDGGPTESDKLAACRTSEGRTTNGRNNCQSQSSMNRRWLRESTRSRCTIAKRARVRHSCFSTADGATKYIRSTDKSPRSVIALEF